MLYIVILAYLITVIIGTGLCFSNFNALYNPKKDESLNFYKFTRRWSVICGLFGPVCVLVELSEFITKSNNWFFPTNKNIKKMIVLNQLRS